MKHLSYKELKRQYRKEKKALSPDKFILEFAASLKDNNESEARNLFAILKKRPDSLKLAGILLMNTCCEDSIKEGKMNCGYIITEIKELLKKPSSIVKGMVKKKLLDDEKSISKD